ncbi:AMP-binding protein, partial [Pseudoalteromonas rhizosphaerae]|uniref:non-ribosomal peptide synthetase n=1 Tax=Pseudoalteromonas rhizosphaerae TaxID=2518973 RepID=UPI00384E5FDB
RLAAQNLSNLAYVIYTSGSTGKPKGVMIEHLAMLSHITNVSAHYSIDSYSVVLQFSSMSFDTSIEQTMSALFNGAKLVIRGNSVQGANAFSELLFSNKVTHFNVTPTYFASVLEAIASVQTSHKFKVVIVGGEAFTAEILDIWGKCECFKHAKLLNAYGPTETTITSSINIVSVKGADVGSIGKAIGCRNVFILDKHGCISPFGVIGEIYIAGNCLARGYLNRPKFTKERFIENPFNSSQRLYKTGDLGRYTENGDLQFLGRGDEQVKLRGYRIELGEIEQRVRALPSVKAAHVTVQGQTNDSRQLVAYVIGQIDAEEALLTENVMSQLAKQLPSYMVPSNIVILSELPLTVNGKVDKKALPLPNEAPESQVVSATTGTQRLLVHIWSELLNLETEKISVNDNFFSLGGHSILAIKMANKVQSALDIELNVIDLFDKSSISAISEHIDELLSKKYIEKKLLESNIVSEGII